MGVGLAFDCRWAFPVYPPCPQRLQDTFFEQMKFCSSYSTFDGSIHLRGHRIWRSYTCSYAQLTLDRSSVVEKINLPGKILKSPVLLQSYENLGADDASTSISCSAEDEFLRFSLLMENISRIEGILSGSDVSELEREILFHIGRLGALKLFQSCFTRMVEAPNIPESSQAQKEHLSSLCADLVPESRTSVVFIHSTKKESRKLKRKCLLESTTEIPIVSSLANAAAGTNMPSKTWQGSPAPLSRSQIAAVESKLSTGVKEVANLERICLQLEEIMGRPPTMMRWAEAAGIDEKVLRQRLHYGWVCRERLLKSTRPLVIYLSRSYTGMGIARDDLIQAGNVGVLLGAERFDISRGNKFSTYIRYWIKKSMSSLVSQHSRGIRIPARIERIYKQLKKAKRSATNNEGTSSQDHDTAQLTNISHANIQLANKCSRTMISIDQKLRGCPNIKLMEVITDTSIETPDAVIMKQQLRIDIHKLLEGLLPREKQVLLLRYGFIEGRCRSLSEIGTPARVSKEWIRKIEKAALSKVRKQEIQEELKYYLHI